MLAEEGCALLIDCRSETARTIPLPDVGMAVLVCDTQVRHSLADGAYGCRHVVSENERALAAAEALSAGDLGAVGLLLYEGHASLRDDFEVSCPELDAVVELAREIGPDGGVLGARMTGGGFGGCALALVRTDRLDAVAKSLASGYRARTGLALETFRARPARGAQVLDGDRVP